MKIKPVIVIVAVAVAGAWSSYIVSQKPKVWCDRQWAGIALLKGGYRSWTMRFCDGEAFIDGEMQPVVVTTNGFEKGYFSWPKFSHVRVP